jgi:hypothetical protein
MTMTSNDDVKTYTLAFNGEHVTSAEVEHFRDVVDMEAKDVCEHIVDDLNKEEEETPATYQRSSGGWLITVGEVAVSDGDAEAPNPPDPPHRTKIYVKCKSSDVPKIINSMRRFFSDWRAVAGFIAVGGTAAGLYYLLTVKRSPSSQV